MKLLLLSCQLNIAVNCSDPRAPSWTMRTRWPGGFGSKSSVFHSPDPVPCTEGTPRRYRAVHSPDPVPCTEGTPRRYRAVHSPDPVPCTEGTPRRYRAVHSPDLFPCTEGTPEGTELSIPQTWFHAPRDPTPHKPFNVLDLVPLINKRTLKSCSLPDAWSIFLEYYHLFHLISLHVSTVSVLRNWTTNKHC